MATAVSLLQSGPGTVEQQTIGININRELPEPAADELDEQIVALAVAAETEAVETEAVETEAAETEAAETEAAETEAAEAAELDEEVMALAGENTAGSSVSERAGSGCWAVKALQGVFKRAQERAAGDR